MLLHARRDTTEVFLSYRYNKRQMSQPEFQISGDNAHQCGERSLLHDASDEQLMAIGVSEWAARGVGWSTARAQQQQQSGAQRAQDAAGSSSQHAHESSHAWAHEDINARWDDDDDTHIDAGGVDGGVGYGDDAEPTQCGQARTEAAVRGSSASTSTTNKVPNLPTPNPPPLHIGGSSHGRRRGSSGYSAMSIAGAIEGLGSNLVSAIAESMEEQRRLLQQQHEQAQRLAEDERAHQMQLASQCRTQ